ncbi:MAG: translation initiation factor eIF-2B [Halobacteriales archaeon]
MIDETVEEIREMRTHSSSDVAVKAARALRSLLDQEFATVREYEQALDRNSRALRRASPSHASLWTTQAEIVAAVQEHDSPTIEAAKARTREAIEDVIGRIESAKQAAAENAAEALRDGATLLTHDYSTTVLAALTVAVGDGKEFEVYVTEARPRHLGRKSARELAALEGVDASLIVDGAAGYYLEDCDRVVFGMDCIVGDALYNRVGTYPIAATAADRGVPVTSVGSSAKLVGEGFRFENEFRAASEVMREPAEGFEIHNPAYDATPVRLLDQVITDEGIQTY